MTPFNMRLRPRWERAARQLDASGDYRVLKRLPRIDEIWCRSAPIADPRNVATLLIVDTETLGLDPSRDKMVEIAVVRMKIDTETGELLDIEQPVSFLEDPRAPLTEAIEALTGLTDATLAGQAFDERAIAAAFGDVTCAVAHNARFDLAFFQTRFPKLTCLGRAAAPRSTGPRMGSAGESVGTLLTAAKMFADVEHRAGPDAWAVAMLLALPGFDGRTIAWHLYQHAKRPTHRLFARGAPLSVKDSLKSAGCRWCPTRRVWWIDADTERLGNEREWLVSLCPIIRPEIVVIDWCDRHLR